MTPRKQIRQLADLQMSASHEAWAPHPPHPRDAQKCAEKRNGPDHVRGQRSVVRGQWSLVVGRGQGSGVRRRERQSLPPRRVLRQWIGTISGRSPTCHAVENTSGDLRSAGTAGSEIRGAETQPRLVAAEGFRGMRMRSATIRTGPVNSRPL
jgi:hypothetical protein